MSEANVEVVREAWRAMTRNDVDQAFRAFSEETEWHLPEELPDSQILVGRSAVTEWYARTLADFRAYDIVFELEEAIDAGDGRVFTTARVTGGAEDRPVVPYRVSQEWEFAGDEIVRVRDYYGEHEARRRAALRE